jgi:hypothetical protein
MTGRLTIVKQFFGVGVSTSNVSHGTAARCLWRRPPHRLAPPVFRAQPDRQRVDHGATEIQAERCTSPPSLGMGARNRGGNAGAFLSPALTALQMRERKRSGDAGAFLCPVLTSLAMGERKRGGDACVCLSPPRCFTGMGRGKAAPASRWSTPVRRCKAALCWAFNHRA